MSPIALGAPLPDFSFLAQGLFFFLLFIFSMYGIFLAYHWFSFGTEKRISTLALAVYLLGGALLFITIAGGIRIL